MGFLFVRAWKKNTSTKAVSYRTVAAVMSCSSQRDPSCRSSRSVVASVTVQPVQVCAVLWLLPTIVHCVPGRLMTVISDDVRRKPYVYLPFRRTADHVRRGRRGGLRRCGPSRRLAPSLLAGQRGEYWVRRVSLAEEQHLVAVRVDGLGRSVRKMSQCETDESTPTSHLCTAVYLGCSAVSCFVVVVAANSVISGDGVGGAVFLLGA